VRLFGVAMAILRDQDAASGALHDGFVNMARRAAQYDPERGAAEAWLGSVVRHAALDIARRRGREIPTDDASLGDISVDADQLETLAAGEFVLGTLEAHEVAELRALMSQDGELALLVSDWEKRLAPLRAMAIPEAPPPGLWARIEATLAGAARCPSRHAGASPGRPLAWVPAPSPPGWPLY